MGGRDALISAVTTGEVIEATRARERLDPCTPRGAYSAAIAVDVRGGEEGARWTVESWGVMSVMCDIGSL